MTRSNSLTQSITNQLGVAIVIGNYAADKPFPIEADLCEQFNASRSVLREAVKMLTAKGLLSARPRQGTRVEPEANWNLFDPDVLRWILERKFSLPLLSDFTEIRLSVEPMAAYLAAQRANGAAIAMIEQAIARMEAAEIGEDDPLQSDIAFHIAVLNASGNRFYTQFGDLIETALKFSIRFTNRFKGVHFANTKDHKKVMMPIINQDPPAAERAMRALVAETLALIKKALAEDKKMGK